MYLQGMLHITLVQLFDLVMTHDALFSFHHMHLFTSCFENLQVTISVHRNGRQNNNRAYSQSQELMHARVP